MPCGDVMAYLKPGVYVTETDHSDFSWGEVLDHPELCEEMAELVSVKISRKHGYKITGSLVMFTDNNTNHVASVYLFDGYAEILLGNWERYKIQYTNKKFAEEIAEVVETVLKE